MARLNNQMVTLLVKPAIAPQRWVGWNPMICPSVGAPISKTEAIRKTWDTLRQMAGLWFSGPQVFDPAP